MKTQSNIHDIIINRKFKSRHDIRNGLMYIKHLPSNVGALFYMKDKRIHKFWMKNTYVSLDLIFMDEKYCVVGTITNTTPLDESLYYIKEPSKYIIEIKHGYVDKYRIKKGDFVNIIYKSYTKKNNSHEKKKKYTRKNKK